MGKQKSRENKISNNLTILDFADSPRSCKRLPKNKLHVKDVIQSEIVEDLIASTYSEDDIASPGDVQRTKKISPQDTDSEHVYNDYHVDIWFLISEYILPEDICKFASICQKTRYVVSTAKFWAHLYRKYYDYKIELPDCLQPDFICRTDGYRISVIRSLFFLYPPFAAERLKVVPDPEHLIKFKCIGCWFRPVKSMWMLCFKFSRNIASYDMNDAMEEREVVESWEDIDPTKESTVRKVTRPTEEGNRILVVNTDRFYPPPHFLTPNLHLSKIIQPLTQDLRAFKLELTFSEYNGRKVGTITYDPIKSIKILRWWEPEYYSYLG